jgi:hypothetical protein
MPQVGFEPTIPAFERAKTVHTLDRAATVIGLNKKIYIHITQKLFVRGADKSLDFPIYSTSN